MSAPNLYVEFFHDSKKINKKLRKKVATVNSSGKSGDCSGANLTV